MVHIKKKSLKKNVVLVFAVQQSESVIHIHISTLFLDSFPRGFYCRGHQMTAFHFCGHLLWLSLSLSPFLNNKTQHLLSTYYLPDTVIFFT